MTKKSNKQLKNERGFIFVLSLITMTVLLSLSVYFLDLVMTEKKISSSFESSTQTYYLAEAGTNEAIWKLKNDPTWKDNFENSSSWSATFRRDNALIANSYWEIHIQNTDIARADITTTGYITLPNGAIAHRIIKTKVFKAYNTSPLGNVGFFTDGPMDLSSGVYNITGANIFSNGGINLTQNAIVNAGTNDVSSHEEVSVCGTGCNLIAGHIYSSSSNPVPDEITLPRVDFDSDDPDSLKSQAIANGTNYSKQEFDNIIDGSDEITLDGIIYVTGVVDIPQNKTIVINGALVVDGNLIIGKSGPSQTTTITINRVPGMPSGLYVTQKIDMGTNNKNLGITINGIIYTSGQLDIRGMDGGLTVNGGVIVNNFDAKAINAPININFSNEAILDGLQQQLYSPIINIAHWEEEY